MSSCPLPSIIVRSSSFFTHFITISPLAPPLVVDCCFKRRTKPLLPTMVSSLSSWPSALVGCFRCPPPPTLVASHGSRRQLSVALTAGNLASPLPCPPLVVATPPAFLPLCGVFQTLAARLAARPYDPPLLGRGTTHNRRRCRRQRSFARRRSCRHHCRRRARDSSGNKVDGSTHEK